MLLAGVGALAVAGGAWAGDPRPATGREVTTEEVGTTSTAAAVIGWVLRAVAGGTLGVCPLVADEVW